MDLPTEISDTESQSQRVVELTELLDASRELSIILDPQELYPVLSDMIARKLGIEHISIFLFRNKYQTFKLAYTHGIGALHREFLFTDIGDIWKEFLQSEPFCLLDASGKPAYSDFFDKFGLAQLHAQWLVPLLMRSNMIGFLVLGDRETMEPVSENKRVYLKEIAAQAAVSINTSRLYLKRKKEKEELDRTLHNLSLLYGIGRAMNYISDLKSLLEYILNQAIQITGAEKGSIMLYDLEKNLLSIRVVAGLRDRVYQRKINNSEIECKRFKPGEGIAGRVFQTGRPMVVDKAREDELFIEPDGSFVRSIACIPMLVYSDVVGVINVTNKLDETGFTDEDVEMLKAVADQAAIAINKAQLWEMAVTDSLTGLYVRRYFIVKLQEELHRAERYNKGFSIVMADLDRFKDVNDSFGHTAGDRMLKLVATFLQKNIRDMDIIARYGGEEFVFLLPEADKEEAFTVSERLRAKLSERQFDDLPRITISLGIASYPEDSDDIDQLIKKADAALYTAKQSGRNRVVVYEEEMELIGADQPLPSSSIKFAN